MNDIVKEIHSHREFFNSLGEIYPADDKVEITSEPIGGVTCYWFTPDTDDDNTIIMYLHGGSFALGSIQSHKAMVSYIASAISTRILFIEYSLAPEKPFPAGVHDVVSVYRELLYKYPDRKISIIGDSAGGGIAVSFVDMVNKGKLQLPASIVLISPWLNLECNSESHEARKNLDPILTKDMLLDYAHCYIGDAGGEANPGGLYFNYFPPVLILVGSNEILYDDSKTFYEKIKPVQSNTIMKEYLNQNHVWLLADIQSQASTDALMDINKFINATTGNYRAQ